MVFLDVITLFTTKKKLIAYSVSEHVKYIQDGHVAKKIQTIRIFLKSEQFIRIISKCYRLFERRRIFAEDIITNDE